MGKRANGEGAPKAPKARRSKAVAVDETALAALAADGPDRVASTAIPAETAAEHRARFCAHYQACRGISAAEAAAMYREVFGA